MEEQLDEAAWRGRIERFRAEHEETLRDRLSDPPRLSYFPIDRDFRLPATLSWRSTPETVSLAANRGPDVEFEHVASLGFDLGGDHTVLAAYRAPGLEDLLVPFRDETNGVETAACGRYVTLDVEGVESGKPVALDFNLAYHPFCVHDDSFASALPPEDNRVHVEIRAGERLPEPDDRKRD
ncbi:MAG: DUF1684 domain-containing protein [Halodesulfurarchaeum sp.]